MARKGDLLDDTLARVRELRRQGLPLAEATAQAVKELVLARAAVEKAKAKANPNRTLVFKRQKGPDGTSSLVLQEPKLRKPRKPKGR